MRFEKISPEKIRITLTAQDLEECQLTYRQMDYDDPKTRSVLQALLVLAEEKADFSCPDRSRLLIELFPAPSGGCSVSFTLLGVPEEIRCWVYGFSDLEALTSCAVKAIDKGGCPALGSCCSLYRKEKEYRILCRPALRPPACLPFLEEYGYLIGTGELAAAFTEEHSVLLAEPDALSKLAKSLR